MSCKHPLKAFPIGKTVNGKTAYKIAPYVVDHIARRGDSWCYCSKDDLLLPLSNDEERVYEWIEIPCGKCIECRLKYSRSWADRCLLEAQQYKHNYFVTLTYNDDHLVMRDGVNTVTGERTKAATLVKEDLQNFNKRLRRQYEYYGHDTENDKIRFYGCGEYGSSTKTHRPHFHVIYFNLDLDNPCPNDPELNDKMKLQFYQRSPQGFNYYRSPFLEKLWSDKNKKQIGFVLVADVTWESCAYTARYVMKKVNGDMSIIYENLNILPEFVLMSRNPGIARDFYEKNKEKIFSLDYVSIPTPSGGKRIYPSRYYEKLFDVENPEFMAEYKDKRIKYLQEKEKGMKTVTDLDYLSRLQVEEDAKADKIKALKRKI